MWYNIPRVSWASQRRSERVSEKISSVLWVVMRRLSVKKRRKCGYFCDEWGSGWINKSASERVSQRVTKRLSERANSLARSHSAHPSGYTLRSNRPVFFNLFIEIQPFGAFKSDCRTPVVTQRVFCFIPNGTETLFFDTCVEEKRRLMGLQVYVCNIVIVA